MPRSTAPPTPAVPLALACLAVLTLPAGPRLPPAAAAPRPGRVEEVATRPAFVRPPVGPEGPATAGRSLPVRSTLRTSRPGRMQVRLGDGRRFRMGGDALVRLGGSGLDLRRGQLIAWIDPGSPRGRPFRVRTRVGTASIMGTTLFIDDSGDRVTFLSWEGLVRLRRNDGQTVRLRAGEVVTVTPGTITPGSNTPGSNTPGSTAEADDWTDPRPLTRSEARRRRRGSRLLNGFQTPMATLPQVEAVLEAAPPAPPAPAP